MNRVLRHTLGSPVVGYPLAVAVPVAVAWAIDTGAAGGLAPQLAVSVGMGALLLLVVTLVLPSRVRTLVSAFGIETVLRAHRVVAVSAVVLVAAHVVLVVATDPRGVSILDLRDTTYAAWAATVSTLGLAGVVVLALRRRRRRPRYEGWRMLHVLLAVTVLTTAWLHVWWLDGLEGRAVVLAVYVVLTVATAAVLLRRWVWLPMRAHRRTYVVEGVRPEAGDVVTVAVKAHGHNGLPFEAGQFAWLKIGASPYVFEEHPFTIASTAEAPHLKQFTIKALGDFSELVAGLRPGRHVYLDGPYGSFTIEGLKASEGFVMIAGGVGLTPMMSMLRTLSDRGDPRHHYLFVGARTVDDLMLRDEVRRLCLRLHVTVTEVLEDPGPGWRGETGRIDAALLRRRLPHHARRHDYFLCDPPVMVAAVGHDLRDLGVPVNRIHTEQFEVV